MPLNLHNVGPLNLCSATISYLKFDLEAQSEFNITPALPGQYSASSVKTYFAWYLCSWPEWAKWQTNFYSLST